LADPDSGATMQNALKDTQGNASDLPKVVWLFVFSSAAFNPIRLPKLLPNVA